MKSSAVYSFLAVAALSIKVQAVNIPIFWEIPRGGSYPDIEAQVGDRVNFTWEFNHNVHIYPNAGPGRECVSTGKIQVEGDNLGTSYLITEEDAGRTIYFACDVASHCSMGQNFAVNVASLPEGASQTPPPVVDNPSTPPTVDNPSTPAPGTPAPVASPTEAPSDEPPTDAPGSCVAFGEPCSFSAECCSNRCLLQQCQKALSPTKSSLAGGRGGAAGQAKLAALNNLVRRRRSLLRG